MSLEPEELEHLTSRLGRSPTEAELHIVAAEWSEHCSYKSSKMHLGMLPSEGPLVITEKGYDSGVLDVGDGYVVTAHIESHNHPSAVEPYGGAATGVGGVIRDILSAGTRPIAIMNGLRFGDPSSDPRALWLFKNAVRGIADYGNCLGIPTVGGEIEFDPCYDGYAMVDVAAVGFGRRERLISNRAEPGDVVMLLGGSTGRDGIGGSQFASDSLGTGPSDRKAATAAANEQETDNRSAVQIPDPFMEKMLIEAVLEARNAGVIHAMKDLGGGGLSCAISETAEALGAGIEINVQSVHARESGMSASEIMTSESQERMLIITDGGDGAYAIAKICAKFGVPYSVIGAVRADGMMRVSSGGDVIAEMPAHVVANARLLDLPSDRPAYLDGIEDRTAPRGPPRPDHSDDLYKLIISPNISSRSWAYGQYDHEVGIRTVVRPGADASVLRLDNGKYLAVSMDGNPKHCYVNPQQGAAGCFEEACRNVVCAGATPIGMLDHLQFGDPNDPGVFWTFMESLRGISDFARQAGIPCIGGKVSLYNETSSGPIKPTPVIAVLGLISDSGMVSRMRDQQKMSEFRAPRRGDRVIMVGSTKDEMGGSEYHEYIMGVVGGGRCPAVDATESKTNSGAVLEVIRAGLARIVHDCSKGGAAVAISELCIGAGAGCRIDISCMPYSGHGGADDAGHSEDNNKFGRRARKSDEVLMFSESHSRYVMIVPDESTQDVMHMLSESGAPHASVGTITSLCSDDGGGGHDHNGDSGAGADHSDCRITFVNGDRTVADTGVRRARRAWSRALGDMMHNAR